MKYQYMDGWEKIIEDMQKKAEPYGVKWMQIKEKFGTLRAYFSCPAEFFDIVDKIVTEAEAKSSKTCVFCGNPGKQAVPKYWIMTVCDSCLEEKEEEERKLQEKLEKKLKISPLEMMLGSSCGECEANKIED